MNRNSISSALFAAACLFAVACGGGGTDYSDPIEAAESATVDTCEKAHDCRDSYPDELAQIFPFETLFGATVSACIDNFTPSEAEKQAVVDAIDAGRATYDADKAEQCAEATINATCEELWSASEGDAACEQVFTGTIDDGEACTTDVECKSQTCDDDVCVADF